ncbi:hypothetical protein [Roseateles amylovorans]|uniref:Uncharacterized protein n=1 Tax=Roseateles amylovorans TaxID=2978473 RepID=A0ABY6B599_9BURK|nr:hypothetical protein [Roseateles amylovorans]UXH80217.1 hypothetical protein N4261_10195 [Roseateles amylovorans]
MLDTLTPNPDRLDYVVFFECEPVWEHPRGWIFGLKFEIINGDDKLVVEFSNHDQYWQMEWSHADEVVIAASCVMVGNWYLERVNGLEWFCCSVFDDNRRPREIRLKIRPRISVSILETW